MNERGALQDRYGRRTKTEGPDGHQGRKVLGGQKGRALGNRRVQPQDEHGKEKSAAAGKLLQVVTLNQGKLTEDCSAYDKISGQYRRPRERPLKFVDLLQLSQETTEPSDIVHRLGNVNCGLESLLQGNLSNWDVQELVLIIMGAFCKKQGATQFQTGFIDLVKILADKSVFKNVSTIIIQLTISRSTNLPPKGERLKRLIEGLYYLTCDIVTLIPRFGCNFLGENFLRDIIALKHFPAVVELQMSESVFDKLYDAIPVLKNAWEQNAKEMASDEHKFQKLERRAEFELCSLEKPPDDFRQLNVVPQTNDICTVAKPFLRPNIIDGSYPDVDTYLDIQFRLLREDFYYPLRVGIQSYKNELEKKTRQIQTENVRLYYEVKIIESDFSNNKYTLSFSTKAMGKIQWEASKRLLFGSLLCLSSDHFTSILLFTVLERKPQQLAQGKITACYEGGVLPKSKISETYVMAESSAYFEAYRSVLYALQRISPANFPLRHYILGMRSTADEPDYMAAVEEVIYDLSSVPINLIKLSDEGEQSDDGTEQGSIVRVAEPISSSVKRMLSKVAIRDAYNRPSNMDLRLDPSQCEALYAALTLKVAVIQGPPGTGKTFLGLKIVEVLLKNSQLWRPAQQQKSAGKPKAKKLSPILVICYTNHALDQFLEGIMTFTKKIVRIGGQSKCQALEPFSLREWKKRAQNQRSLPAEIGRWFHEIRDEMAKQLRELNAHREIMTAVKSTGLVHEETMKKMKVLDDSTMTKLKNWKKEWNRRNPAGMISASVLPHWLGVNSPGQVAQLIAIFSEQMARRKPTEELVAVEADEDGELNEADRWEKEDIDEIEAQRLIDDGALPSTPFDASNKPLMKLSAEAGVTVQFGYLTDKNANEIVKLETQLKDLREAKEVNESDSWELQSKKLTEAKLEELEKLVEELQDLNAKIEAIELKLVLKRNKVSKIRKLLEIAPHVDTRQLARLETQDLNRMSYPDRWMLYASWRKQVLDLMEQKENFLEAQYAILVQERKDIDTFESAEVCRTADIVGITTTGAAKQRALLEHLKPKIVVVEEAAEVLEAHIITSLSSACQHLILIGDHQQLRPSTTVYHLAKKYHLDVSLFERFINNGIKPCVLGVQHRMRPEVARLIVPSIYKTLENHQSVYEYPEIRGMVRSVFFLAHAAKEIGDGEAKSHVNPYEVDVSLALARHLLMQGYKTDQITILTTYSGQLLQFRKSRQGHAILQGVRISTVDNFQGEENDIIILSLVRSNKDDNIGFLKIENRICVALSRAKQGFYLLGNMNSLQGNSRLWNNICQVLQTNGELGGKFPLKCEIHGTITQASKPTEFPPEGGCMRNCEIKLPCGHICPKICHLNDRSHVEYRCNVPCARSCDLGHPCPKKCWQDCKPCLSQVVKKLPCDHLQDVECHKDPNEEYCQTKMEKKLLHCNHKQEMDCGKSPADVRCVEECGMLLDCNHICNLRCHKQSTHKEKLCLQPCRRSPCLENHSCPKLCHESCGNCITEVEKKLPCGHEVKVKCFILPKDAFCPIRIEKTLDCGHSAMFQCSEPTDTFKCKKPCQNLLCSDGHPCRKPCHQECGPCKVQVERRLPCGHMRWMECHRDPGSTRCTFPVERLLPGCGHNVSIACGDDPSAVRCPMPCDIRLECGHTCTEKCHANKDPDHEHYTCKKSCEKTKKNCKENHKCSRKCYEECDPCEVKKNRHLPCGHEAFVECHLNDMDVQCREQVTKILDCGHSIKVQCFQVPSRALCTEDCQMTLACGHQCKKKCKEVCALERCEETVTVSETNSCGHCITMKCHDYRTGGWLMNEKMKETLQLECAEKCSTVLACEHPCKGSCGRCFNGRVHVSCHEKCGRTLVCGHSCTVNCATSCPPCKKKCEYRCQHSRCTKDCCEPCAQCQESCGWTCEHFKCTRKCWQRCDRPPCDQPCKRKLGCGHPCIGLCGEQCPPLCRICNKEQLTEFILYGNEEDDEARFVYLPDCDHCIEVEGMDHWMGMNVEEFSEIQMKCCPRCKTIIRTCLRYGDILKKNYEDIVLVKKKLLDAHETSRNFVSQMTPKLQQVLRANGEMKNGFSHPISSKFQELLLGLFRKMESRKRQGQLIPPTLDSDDRHVIQVKIDLVGRMLELLKKAIQPERPNVSNSVSQKFGVVKKPSPTAMKPELLQDITWRTEGLFDSLKERKRMSDAEYQDMVHEINRLAYIRTFFLLKSSTIYGTTVRCDQETAFIESLLLKNVKKLTEHDKSKLKNLLQAMAKKLETGLDVSDEERLQIFKAVGLEQRHWYKCPKGHIYAIGNCGMPSQSGSCIECGAAIGSGGTTLHAGDMGRASFTEERHNIADWHLNDLH